MQPIQPVGGQSSHAASQGSAIESLNSGAVGASQSLQTGSSATVSTQTVALNTSMTHIAQVSSRVDTFLEGLGGNMQNSDLLKMIIGLLILELLLGEGGEDGKGGRGSEDRLSAMAQLSSSSQSARTLLIESSTSSYESITQTTTGLSASSSVQSSEAAQSGSAGQQIDLSA
ncbi:MAG: hypothetical protein GY842_15210 [bacterium]|nr:hypothetical protein [bacterium]